MRDELGLYTTKEDEEALQWGGEIQWTSAGCKQRANTPKVREETEQEKQPWTQADHKKLKIPPEDERNLSFLERTDTFSAWVLPWVQSVSTLLISITDLSSSFKKFANTVPPLDFTVFYPNISKSKFAKFITWLIMEMPDKILKYYIFIFLICIFHIRKLKLLFKINICIFCFTFNSFS